MSLSTSKLSNSSTNVERSDPKMPSGEEKQPPNVISHVEEHPLSGKPVMKELFETIHDFLCGNLVNSAYLMKIKETLAPASELIDDHIRFVHRQEVFRRRAVKSYASEIGEMCHVSRAAVNTDK